MGLEANFLVGGVYREDEIGPYLLEQQPLQGSPNLSDDRNKNHEQQVNEFLRASGILTFDAYNDALEEEIVAIFGDNPDSKEKLMTDMGLTLD